jgi:hypothetical protein
VQVGAVRNRITQVDPHTKADGTIRWLIAVMDWNLLLYSHCTAHRSIDAVKGDEQRIAAGLNDPATMLLDRWVYQVLAQSSEPSQGSGVVQTDQATVADHIGIDDGDQLPPIRRPSVRVRCVGFRHAWTPINTVDTLAPLPPGVAPGE